MPPNSFVAPSSTISVSDTQKCGPFLKTACAPVRALIFSMSSAFHAAAGQSFRPVVLYMKMPSGVASQTSQKRMPRVPSKVYGLTVPTMSGLILDSCGIPEESTNRATGNNIISREIICLLLLNLTGISDFESPYGHFTDQADSERTHGPS